MIRRKVAGVKLSPILAFTLVVGVNAAVAQTPLFKLRGQISGVVLFPDGTPAAGATVEAEEACGHTVSLVHEVTTDAKGEFNVPPFYQNCTRIRLTARKDLWLKTGEDPFYGKQIGTSPLVQLSKDSSPQRVEVRLGELGGKAVFRVRDNAAQGFIRAELTLRVAHRKRAWVRMIATGDSGEPHDLLLAPGAYTVSVTRFRCHGKDFIVATPTAQVVTIEGGKTSSIDISLDTSTTKARKSYDNPSGDYCAAKEGY